jgi:hypothetical protein
LDGWPCQMIILAEFSWLDAENWRYVQP